MDSLEIFQHYVDRVGSKTLVAERLGLSIPYISELYHGRKPITLKVAQRIHRDTGGMIRRETLIDWESQ